MAQWEWKRESERQTDSVRMSDGEKMERKSEAQSRIGFSCLVGVEEIVWTFQGSFVWVFSAFGGNNDESSFPGWTPDWVSLATSKLPLAVKRKKIENEMN